MAKNIKLLSYNVCWSCMGPDKNSQDTARDLGNLCYDKSKQDKKQLNNICMKNVTDVMLNNDYDLILTQETKNWKQIYSIIQKNNNDFKYICFQASDIVYIVTFYDSSKLELLGAKFIELTKTEVGRPAIIANFKHINTNNEFICINIHGPHKNINFNTITNTNSSINMNTNLIDKNITNK